MPNPRFAHVYQLVKQITVPGYSFNLGCINYGYSKSLVWLRVTYNERDVFTGTDEKQQGRRWIIENDASDAAIIQTCFKAYLTSLEHRARESFQFNGKAILHPHHNLDELVSTARVHHEATFVDDLIQFQAKQFNSIPEENK